MTDGAARAAAVPGHAAGQHASGGGAARTTEKETRRQMKSDA